MKGKSYKGQILLGKYKILHLITQGGMDSSIYLAEDISFTERNYFSNKYKYSAVKIIEKTKDTADDQWEKILDEGTTTGRLIGKKNIVELYEFTKLDENTILIIMEYVDGPSLSKYITNSGTIPLNESIYIFEQILIGVNELHKNSNIIIHRDLKPDNILISKDLSKIKIIDFGISSVFKRNKDQMNNMEAMTNEESFYGTIPYITPDVLNYRKQSENNLASLITKQFDFHSLGVIFYEMITGKKLYYYEDENSIESIKFPCIYDIVPMKSIFEDFPNDIENIILRLVSSKEQDYHYRYSSIDEILDDLKNYKLRIKNHEPEPTLLKKPTARKLQFAPKFNVYKEGTKFYKNNKIISKLYLLATVFVIVLLIIISLFFSGIF
ncbi:MAG: serine/threonine-protein kinase [Mycoplasmoidaceae bacterium]